ncbi:hypothetical protein [Nocardioides sp.]|uniref:hypothetical protein n=1 Tax=Nocardioides sp. TaxID=35761 RepID=UPI00356AFC93
MAIQSHKRDTNARFKPRAITIAAPLALTATLSAVSLGVLLSDPVATTATSDVSASTALSQSLAQALPQQASRDESVTRSFTRAGSVESKATNALSKSAIRKAIKGADTTLYATADLNVWTEPGKKAERDGEIEAGKKLLVTGREMWGRTEVVLGGASRWVTSGYLSKNEPPALGGACTNGTSVAGGVSSSIRAIHAAVCANFPEIGVYGTLRGGGGDHGTGRAVDIMVSGARGWQVANFIRDNYSALGVSYIIFSQKIWSVERGGEGWRGMSNRGSATANHYDHVHVSVF